MAQWVANSHWVRENHPATIDGISGKIGWRYFQKVPTFFAASHSKWSQQKVTWFPNKKWQVRSCKCILKSSLGRITLSLNEPNAVLGRTLSLNHLSKKSETGPTKERTPKKPEYLKTLDRKLTSTGGSVGIRSKHQFLRDFIYLHPPKQTWNLKMDPWKRRFLLETIISRFHVNFLGCKGWRTYVRSLYFVPRVGSGPPWPLGCWELQGPRVPF